MKKYIYTCLLLHFLMAADAQSRLNFGLTKKQADSVMPVSKGMIDRPISKATAPPQVQQVNFEQQKFELKRGWLLAEDSIFLQQKTALSEPVRQYKQWNNATVPGTVLTSLVQQGKYPDPYIGLNNISIPESLARKSWWYYVSFEIKSFPVDKKMWLNLEGVNYKAEVWLNGHCLGELTGAFVEGRFDITHLVTKGKVNHLYIKIQPPHNPGIPHEQSYKSGMGPNGGQLCLDGPTFISSEGWDWVPGIRDRNIGIWQPVYLEMLGVVSVQNHRVVTDLPLPDTTKAFVHVEAEIQNHSNKLQIVEFVARIDSVTVIQKAELKPGEIQKIAFHPQSFPQLVFQQPKLWWPNGYGNQHLYTLQTQVFINGVLSDKDVIRFGVRELSYELAARFPDHIQKRFEYSPTDIKSTIPLLDNVQRLDVGNKIFIPTIRSGIDTSHLKILPEFHPYLVIKVNGERIFCKGGNWGMDDAMKKISRASLEPAFKLHKHANFNMIRNWTGESTEKVFYELADEYGMLVWNDFWISTEGYNLNPSDQALWLKNAEQVIKRFRNHPSIAIWCPRNEGYAPSGIEDELADMLTHEDGTRHYIGNSREINLRQSGGWHYVEDPREYFTKYADGFSTEIGTFSVPLEKTIQKFLKKEDWWPINDAWHYHDLHSNNQNLEGYLNAVDSLYGKPKNLADFSRKVQLINYESHRAIFEAWNNKLWKNASGVLLWMTHPAWPSMIWQTYSWDYETFGSFYGAKKAIEPLHIQQNMHDKKIVAVNNSSKHIEVEARIQQFDLNGIRLSDTTLPIKILANSALHLSENVIKPIMMVDQPWLLRLQLSHKNVIVSHNDYWNSGTKLNFRDFNTLIEASVVISSLEKHKDGYRFIVTNTGKNPAIGVRFFAKDKGGEDILPALFSDGYIHLMPGESRKIDLTGVFNYVPHILMEGYNLSISK